MGSAGKGLRRIAVMLCAFGISGHVKAGEHDVVPFENVTVFSKLVRHGVYTRNVLYLKPAQAAPGRAPAVVMLHYFRGVPEEMAGLVEAGRLARDAGLWVILPQAVNGDWNYHASPLQSGRLEVADDVGFLADLITRSVDEYGLDPRRIYMAGYSNGGLMAMTFACKRPELVAAVGDVARASIASVDAARCTPGLPVPMLLVNGTADKVSIYNGQALLGVSRILSAPATAALWASLDGCAPTPDGADLPDLVQDSSTVHLDVFRGCTGGSEVAFYTVNGGGHTWPGALDFSSGLGVTNQDVSATTLLQEFFLRFRRP